MKSYETKQVIFHWVDVNYPLKIAKSFREEEDSLEYLYYLKNYLPTILSMCAVNVLQNVFV